MIGRIRDRIIYSDPSQYSNAADVERRRVQEDQFRERVQMEGLIPSTSGPPPRLFGQHLPLAEEPEEKKPEKKKISGVWYVPWYDEEDELTPLQLETRALSEMDAVLKSLNSSPSIVWDTAKQKGMQSRDNFARYMQLVGVAMWRQAKSVEDDCLFPGGSSGGSTSKAMTGLTQKRTPLSSVGAARGRGSARGGSTGGPSNSANQLGTGRRGGRG